MFEKSAEMSRTEPELINALTYECVSTRAILWPWTSCVSRNVRSPTLKADPRFSLGLQATRAQIAFITAYPSYAEKVSDSCLFPLIWHERD